MWRGDFSLSWTSFLFVDALSSLIASRVIGQAHLETYLSTTADKGKESSTEKTDRGEAVGK